MAISKPGKPNIFDYLDYRQFLTDWIAYLRGEDPEFSNRNFAKKAGFGSSSYLRMVLQKKRGLTPQSAKKIIGAAKLAKDEGDFFLALIKFNQSKDVGEYDQNFQALLKFRKLRLVRRTESDQYEFFSTWYIVAILEGLGTAWAKRSISEMAESLQISKEEVQHSLDILKNLGFVSQRGDLWVRHDIGLDTPVEMQSLNVRNLHRQMIQKGLEALDKFEVHHREFGSLTISLNEKSFELIRTRLVQLREELNALYSNEKHPEKVFQLNYQLFPLVEIGPSES